MPPSGDDPLDFDVWSQLTLEQTAEKLVEARRLLLDVQEFFEEVPWGAPRLEQEISEFLEEDE